ncbi:DUF7601 domain-containing protein [Collinsella tanakaei]|uniref:DUF7601 domain-containing protein n=1 Tax=Collinsella tanakaei TaxID=626935 RepID=UPI0025A43639|nr:FctA domain-containing protein [Collinsella tanakaei]MDM8302911.1 FctA domain-containing protein [Collinsella tanakaei]
MHRHIRPRVLPVIFAVILSATLASPLAASAVPDTDATADLPLKIVDPDTSTSWEDLFRSPGSAQDAYSFSTEQAGRIWADKSVYAADDQARDAGVAASLRDRDRGFLVSLSALSSSASIRHEDGLSHDVVFVVSANAVLADKTYNGRAQADHLVSALNAAISRLMAENGGAAVPTRVGVVAYSSEVTVLMPLAVYAPDGNGSYLAYEARANGRDPRLVVTGTADGVQTSNAALRSGSYLQRAVHVGADMLEAAAADPTAASRAPELIVMGIQTPPMANVDLLDPAVYTGAADGFLGPLPHLRENGYGTDAMLATLLTMRADRQRIERAWEHGGGPLKVYTTGLDTTATVAYLLETAAEQEHRTLPGSGAAAGIDLADNLEQAATRYAEAAANGKPAVALDLYGSSPSGLAAKTVTLPCIPDLLKTSGEGLSSVDEYFCAHSAQAVSWAFTSAVNRILGIEYAAPTPTAPSEAGDVTVRDAIGVGMQLTDMKGIQYGSTLLDGALAAQAVTIGVQDPWDIEATHEFAYIVDAVNERYDLGYAAYDLLFDAFSDGQFAYGGADDYSNRASWYVDADHRMVASDERPYTFASERELAAVHDGDWEADAPDDVRAAIETARDHGAAAVCETWFYIGNLPNQYTGGDVTLYDFVIMVETDLATGRQTLLAAIPADAVPAMRTHVDIAQDGQATMTVDDPEQTDPVRLVYEVAPTSHVADVLDRITQGGTASDADLEQAIGTSLPHTGTGATLLFAGAFTDTGGEAQAGAGASAIAAPANAYYLFGEATPLYTLVDGTTADPSSPNAEDLAPLRELPRAGATYYVEQTVYEAAFDSPDEVVAVEPKQRFVPYVAQPTTEDSPYSIGEDGVCVVAAGTPTSRPADVRRGIAKNPNATGSAPYSIISTIKATDGSTARLSARLGNNGVLVVPPAAGTAELTVGKRVDAGEQTAPAASDRTFSFRITLTRADGTPLAGPILLRGPAGDEADLAPLDDGKITLELADGQQTTLAGLPAGCTYRIEEKASGATTYDTSFRIDAPDGTTDGDGVTAEGTLAAGTSVATFTNRPTAGSIHLTKTVIGNDGDATFAFPFEVKLARTDDRPLPQTLAYRIGDTAQTGTATVADDGIVRLEGDRPVALADGDELTIMGVPIGVSYTVRETDADGHTPHIDKSIDDAGAQRIESDHVTGAIDADGQVDTLAFTNERVTYGTLEVTKRTVGDASRTPFAFTVELVGDDGTPLSGTVRYRIDGSSDPSQEATLEDGAFTIELTGGQTLIVDGIPCGTTYDVRERDYSADGYLTLQSGATGTIDEAPAHAVFANVKTTGALGIAAIATGNAAEPDRTFSFDVTLSGLFAAQPAACSTLELTAMRYDGTEDEPHRETITFERVEGGDDGHAVIADVAGATGLVIDELAPGMAFRVEELDAQALKQDGYRISLGREPIFVDGTEVNPYDGVLADGGISTVYAVNARDLFGDLALSNRIEGAAAEADAQAGMRFRYTIDARTATGDPVTGTYPIAATGNVTVDNDATRDSIAFVNGRARVSIAGNGTLTVQGIPAGGNVTISQEDTSTSGYTTAPNLVQESQLAPAETTEVSYTNTKEYRPVSVAIAGTSTMRGRPQRDGEFTYELLDAHGDPVTVDGTAARATSSAAPADESAPWTLPDLAFDAPGTFAYRVAQALPDDREPGVTYDERVYDVTVTVISDSVGNLSATIASDFDGTESPIAFVNSYTELRGSALVTGIKRLDGAAPAPGRFSFTLQEIDDEGEPVGDTLVARNDATGAIAFGPFALETPAGTETHRTFLMRESVPDDAASDGIDYDTRTFRITLTGTDGGNGVLELETAVACGAAGQDGAWETCEEAAFENRTVSTPDNPEGPDGHGETPGDPDAEPGDSCEGANTPDQDDTGKSAPADTGARLIATGDSVLPPIVPCLIALAGLALIIRGRIRR